MILPQRGAGGVATRPTGGALTAVLALSLASAVPSAGAPMICLSPDGDDGAAGTVQAPFRSLQRAQEAARALCREMHGDVVVSLAPGDYRIERALELTDADAGRNGFRVVYRSAAGPGKARLLGSRVLTGWQPFRDGIWRIALPAGTRFHTLYENGVRVHKARFPNRESDPRFPTAMERYLVSTDGSPELDDRAGRPPSTEPGWLEYRSEDASPVTTVTTMRIHLFAGGRRDWVRENHAILAIDLQSHRLTLAKTPYHGIGAGCRFFLEDELGFLDARGEFYLDRAADTLYYKPVAAAHPDTLGIAYPVLSTLVRIKGASRQQCVENLVLDGLTLAETDNAPPAARTAADGLGEALVWMRNTAQVEIRDAHLMNSGRNGIVMDGHNVGNRVSGCLIEHMGVNGVSLSNRRLADDGKSPTLDRCERNRVTNTRISHVGELHTYAECVSAFNVSHNEVDHCQLDNSARFAVTLRGNTGVQYGPPVSTAYPPATGNRFHHLSISRCGQDGGDMGALHAANLNNPGGGCVNTFEQITVADTRAVASVRDVPPSGVFLDWPKMAMDQVFRHVHIVRSQGAAFRPHGPDNGTSAQCTNVSWLPGFDPESMDYDQIGLMPDFPAAFGPPAPRPVPPPAPTGLTATAPDAWTVALAWAAPDHAFIEPALYTVFRDGVAIATVGETRFLDRGLREDTTYRYQVAARDGEFCRPSPRSAEGAARTPPDRVQPTVLRAWRTRAPEAVRVLFSKPMAFAGMPLAEAFVFTPAWSVAGIRVLTPDCLELAVTGAAPADEVTLAIGAGLTDATPSRNPLAAAGRIAVGIGRGAAYAMQLTADGLLLDRLGAGGDARLCGEATVEAEGGPYGLPALVLDGKTAYAAAPPGFDLGPGDFTIMLWIWGQGGTTVLSEGSGFGSPAEWNLRWSGGPGALRVNNRYYFSPAVIEAQTWTHLALVRRGNQGFAYVNGEPCGAPEDLSTLGPLVNDKPLLIGRRHHEKDPTWFRGKVAGVELRGEALDEAAVRARARGEGPR